MSRKKRNNQKRKGRNRAERDSRLAPTGERRERGGSFFGKSRKGDAAELQFSFSDVPVQFNPENPSEGLVERTSAQKALWDSLGDTVH